LPGLPTPTVNGNNNRKRLLPTPTSQLNAPPPWKDGVPWWLQSRATRNLEGVVTGNTPLLPTPMTSYSQRTAEEWRDGRPAGNGGRREHIGDLGIVTEQLLPTPVAHDDGKTPEAHIAMKTRMGSGRKAITSLSVVAQTLLPTPQAHDSATPKTAGQIAEMRERAPRRSAGGRPGVSNLNEAVDRLLPTPNARDGKGANTAHGGAQRYRNDNGRPYGPGDTNLPLAVEQLLPTPMAGEARHGSPGQHRTRGDTMLTGEVLALLRTPGGYDGDRGGAQPVAKRRAGGHGITLQDQACDLLPTPSVSLATG
jgi:hypothetical protein